MPIDYQQLYFFIKNLNNGKNDLLDYKVYKNFIVLTFANFDIYVFIYRDNEQITLKNKLLKISTTIDYNILTTDILCDVIISFVDFCSNIKGDLNA